MWETLGNLLRDWNPGNMKRINLIVLKIYVMYVIKKRPKQYLAFYHFNEKYRMEFDCVVEGARGGVGDGVGTPVGGGVGITEGSRVETTVGGVGYTKIPHMCRRFLDTTRIPISLPASSCTFVPFFPRCVNIFSGFFVPLSVYPTETWIVFTSGRRCEWSF